MASIRRTLSPAHYHYNNGGGGGGGSVMSPLSLSSPSHKSSSSNGKPSPPPPSSSTAALVSLRRSIATAFSRKDLRRASHRCLLFFLLGILLGAFPSSHVELPEDPVRVDVVEQPRVDVVEQPRVDAQLDVNGSAQSLVNSVSLEAEAESNYYSYDYLPQKQLIVVTPTYNRATQAYFLNRVGQALRLVQPPLVWIVVETGAAASTETAEMLRKTGVMYRHLVCNKNLTDVKDRGVHQRNTALEHIEKHRLDGIVYFADDDNVYTFELFESLRHIGRFGTWPVAMLAPSKNKAIVEGPVCNASQVIGWHTNEKSKRLRRFHVDMSGFAFNSTILWDPKRWQRPFLDPIRQLDTVKEGFQETTFIKQVVEDESQMEGIPPSCSKILNWHLHLEARNVAYPNGWQLQKNLDVVLPIT